MLSYDFNQSGGNVIDRTGGGCNAERIGFGPDGDAWGSALGVFTLDTEALLYGDVSAEFLTNYKHPYIKGSGTVNPNKSVMWWEGRPAGRQAPHHSGCWQGAHAVHLPNSLLREATMPEAGSDFPRGRAPR